MRKDEEHQIEFKQNRGVIVVQKITLFSLHSSFVISFFKSSLRCWVRSIPLCPFLVHVIFLSCRWVLNFISNTCMFHNLRLFNIFFLPPFFLSFFLSFQKISQNVFYIINWRLKLMHALVLWLLGTHIWVGIWKLLNQEVNFSMMQDRFLHRPKSFYCLLVNDYWCWYPGNDLKNSISILTHTYSHWTVNIILFF